MEPTTLTPRMSGGKQRTRKAEPLALRMARTAKATDSINRSGSMTKWRISNKRQHKYSYPPPNITSLKPSDQPSTETQQDTNPVTHIPTMSTPFTKTTLILSACTSLLGAGGILSLTLFDIPILASQPASQSLPSTRWLFSRGSHVFPTAALLSGGGFLSLAYASIPKGAGLLEILRTSGDARFKVLGYVAASLLSMSIGPVTGYMIPTNFRLIELNERKGGARSAGSAAVGDEGGRSAEESVDGKGQVSQWRDVSGPQGETREGSTPAEDGEVRALLEAFGRMNAVRGVLLGLGGVVGLAVGLA